jgi:hypothetical protein
MNKYAILDNSNDYLIPPVIKEAAEKHGMTVPELLEKAAASYDDFLEKGIDLLDEYDGAGMEKKAEMEKLSYMEKQAVITLATLAAAAAIPFSLWSAYDLGKNVIGGTGDIARGDFKKAFKRAPAMAFDTLGILPGVGVAGKGWKFLKGVKGLKWADKWKLLNKTRQGIDLAKKAPGAMRSAEALKAGKRGWNPFNYFRSDAAIKAKGAAKAAKYSPEALAQHNKELSELGEKLLGPGGGKLTKPFEGDLGWGRALGFTNKPSANPEMLTALEKLHSPYWHKFYQHVDPLDAVSMLRIAPMIPLLGGAITKNEGLQQWGAKGLDYLNYYGEDPEQQQRAAQLAQARAALQSAGYMAGYAGGGYI